MSTNDNDRALATDRAFTRDEIRDIAASFQRSRMVLTAFEMGVFRAIGKRPRSSRDVSAAIGANPRATDRLMNALCALGLLNKSGGLFSNTRSSARFLVRGEPEYMAGLMHTAHLWDTWSTLTGAVRRGTRVASRPGRARSAEWRTAFIDAMHDRARSQAPAVVRQLDLSGVTRVLDVGGGSGTYAMAFVRARSGLTATVFDLPGVIPLTKAFIESEGLEEKITTVKGDYLRDELGKGFDLVFLSAVIHSNAPSENRRLIRKCARALVPHGRVVIQDFIMDDDRVNPPHGAFFALNMLVGTEAGDTYTEAEVRSWMEDAGLSGIVRHDTPFGTSHIIGRKGN